jgi:hypothetical protein
MKKPKIRKITIKKKHFKTFIHLNFITGVLYAFYHYIRTPKSVDMATRRLWAAETWIIFTLYSIFIYLFSLEIATEDGEPILRKLFKIKRHITIRKPKEEIIRVFDYIKENPDKYSFKTHQGIFPVKGNLTESGSIFQTKERFAFLPITLTFSTLGKTEDSFEFKLIKPLKNLEIVGEFKVKEITKEKSQLFLSVFSENDYVINHIILAIIFISPVRIFIAKQLSRELRFIKGMVKEKK